MKGDVVFLRRDDVTAPSMLGRPGQQRGEPGAGPVLCQGTVGHGAPHPRAPAAPTGRDECGAQR